jgi:hypothetical protein
MRAMKTPGPPGLRWLGGLAAAVLIAAAAHAQTPAAEEAVEAAYLHKFPGFVDWPADAFKASSSPIVIGIAGAPAVLEELTRIARGRLVLGRPVEARAVSSPNLPPGLHVLFVGKAAPAALARSLIEDARQAHVLTVTDMPDGLKAGAVLDFVQVDGRLRFEASIFAAGQADLRLSSKLLSVAAKVIEEAP